MKPELVLLFVLLRGYYGSISDRAVCDRFKDFMTLSILFSNLNLKLPGTTTILENINALSNETRDFISNCYLKDIFELDLDDFSYVMFDSTSVSASACIKSIDLSPSEKQQLLKIHDRMEEDLLMLSPVLFYTEERVFNEIVLPSTEKIISLSDETAVFIKKLLLLNFGRVKSRFSLLGQNVVKKN